MSLGIYRIRGWMDEWFSRALSPSGSDLTHTHTHTHTHTRICKRCTDISTLCTDTQCMALAHWYTQWTHENIDAHRHTLIHRDNAHSYRHTERHKHIHAESHTHIYRHTQMLFLLQPAFVHVPMTTITVKAGEAGEAMASPIIGNLPCPLLIATPYSAHMLLTIVYTRKAKIMIDAHLLLSWCPDKYKESYASILEVNLSQTPPMTTSLPNSWVLPTPFDYSFLKCCILSYQLFQQPDSEPFTFILFKIVIIPFSEWLLIMYIYTGATVLLTLLVYETVPLVHQPTWCLMYLSCDVQPTSS